VSFEPFAYKPVALFSASPRSLHADPALRETLQTMSAAMVDAACFSHQLVGARMSEEDMLGSAAISGSIRAALAALQAFSHAQQPGNASFPLA
jgi:hypothetical protein